MSTISSYPTRTFKESQKFFVLDPQTGSPSFVQGSDLVKQLTPNSNYVFSESTRTTAQATDYPLGAVIQTGGATSVGDNLAGVYLVVPSGVGDFPMDNGNELLVLAGDDTLREQLVQNTATNGSDLIAHTGTTDTVTQALDKRTVFVADRTEMKALTVAVGTNVYLTEDGRAGDFVIKSGTPPSDPQEGIYVVLNNGNYAERTHTQYLTDEMFGNVGQTNMLSPDAISDDVGFSVRNPAQDGLLASSKTLVDGAEHIFDASSRAYKAVDNKALVISQHGVADIPRLAGQIAQNVESFVTDGDRVYALIKGSYSLNDSSLLAGYQITKGGLDALGYTVDLGTGADCRAMATANGFVYIFKGASLLVYKTDQYAPPTLFKTVVRPNSGFVQTCSIIDGMLVAPVWGSANIETYSLNERGVPILHESFTVTAGSSNASIVDANDGSFLLIRHVSGTDALGRFFFDSEKNIVDMVFFTVPEMLQCRYGVVRNSFLYTGSFSTGNLVEVGLAPEVISGATRTFQNMSSFIVYDNYVIGARTDTEANSAINLDTGVIYPLESGLSWIYPQVYGDTFLTFINGNEAAAPGAAANDSPMGQKIAVYKLRNSAGLDYPKSPVVPSVRSINTGNNCESSYEIAGLAAGFNLVGDVKQLDGLGYAWLEIKVSGFVIDNQASGTSAYKVFEGRALLLYSVGTWTVKQAYADDVSKGTSAVTFQLSTGTGLGFGFNSGAALSGAIGRLKVEIRSQNSKVLSL